MLTGVNFDADVREEITRINAGEEKFLIERWANVPINVQFVENLIYTLYDYLTYFLSSKLNKVK
jgi:hypothetical protein